MGRRTVPTTFPARFTGDGMMLKGPYQSPVWHARSKDGVDRLSALPDELLERIFAAAQEVWSDGVLGKPFNLSRRLLPFDRQLQYEAPLLRDWPRFRLFVRTVLAWPELAALVRSLQVVCPEPAAEPPFASGEEHVAFWKRLGGLQNLEVTAPTDVLPTMDELAQFEPEELLTMVASARTAGDFVDWAGPEPINAPANLLRLAPNVNGLSMWVDDKLSISDASDDGSIARYPSLTTLDLRGHLTQARDRIANLLGSFPNLASLDLKELAPGQDLDALVGALDLPQLETLGLASSAEGERHGGGQVFYFGVRPPRTPPPPVTASLAKFGSLKNLKLECASAPEWLLTLPKTVERVAAGEDTRLTLPILTRLLSPDSPDRLPNLKMLHAEFLPGPLQDEYAFGLRLGKAEVPFLPVLDNGEPDFGLKEFWDFTPRFGVGSWSYEAFDELARLAETGGVALLDAPLMYPYLIETWKREELEVRAELKRKWEAGELVWRVDDREIARTMGYQKETGDEPEAGDEADFGAAESLQGVLERAARGGEKKREKEKKKRGLWRWLRWGRTEDA